MLKAGLVWVMTSTFPSAGLPTPVTAALLSRDTAPRATTP